MPLLDIEVARMIGNKLIKTSTDSLSKTPTLEIIADDVETKTCRPHTNVIGEFRYGFFFLFALVRNVYPTACIRLSGPRVGGCIPNIIRIPLLEPRVLVTL